STLISPRVWNYGLAAYDRTHVVKVNWLYEVPSGYAQRWSVAKAILGHWQINGIASFISGAPLAVSATTTTGADITGSPTDPLSRTNMTGKAVLPKDQRTGYQYFNTAAFALPAVGPHRNEPKTVFPGPGVN